MCSCPRLHIGGDLLPEKTASILVPTTPRARVHTKFSIDGLYTISYAYVLYHCAKAILVLTTVLGRPRHVDAKNGAKKYQGPTTSQENMIRKHLTFRILEVPYTAVRGCIQRSSRILTSVPAPVPVPVRTTLTRPPFPHRIPRNLRGGGGFTRNEQLRGVGLMRPDPAS